MEKLMVLICFIRNYGVRGPDLAINWRSVSVLTYSAAGTLGHWDTDSETQFLNWTVAK